MSTRNRRKRKQKPSKRWREFVGMPRQTEDRTRASVPEWWRADHIMPSFAGGGVWSADDEQRHAL